MNTNEQFKKLEIDFASIGIQQLEHYENYCCTPKDAVIIGSAGMDGIHYCTIPEFGEMIFAVSPMNFGDCVLNMWTKWNGVSSSWRSCTKILPFSLSEPILIAC